MSIFNRPRNVPTTLEVETSDERVFQRVKEHLLEYTPGFFWNSRFQRTINWRVLSIKRGEQRIRGLAYYSAPEIELRLNGSLEYIDNSMELSTRGALEDLTPVGTLAHEVGHKFQWWLTSSAVSKEGNDLVQQYNSLGERTAISFYGRTDPLEDWAEAYRVFVLNPTLLKSRSPERYRILYESKVLMQSKTGILLDRKPNSSPRAQSSLEALLKGDTFG